MLDFGRRNLHQDVALLDAAADVDVSCGNVSARASEDVGQIEGQGRAGPKDGRRRRARAHRGGQNCRNEVARLFGRRYDFGMKLIVTPTAITHRAEQNEQRAKPQQATSGAARGPVLNFALRLANRLGFAGSEKLDRSSVVLNVHHSNPSANTPCATLPSAPLRSVANKYGTSSSVVGVANRRPPTTARAKAAFCSPPGSPIAIGSMPTIIAVAVISTGRIRVTPASTAASSAGFPASCSSRA